jgi:hypothetical protein
MAFGASSKSFVYAHLSVWEGTTLIDLDTNTINLALYSDTPTPDATVAAANTAYGAGVWAGNEIIDSTSGGAGWPAKGYALVNKTHACASNVMTFDNTVDPVSTDNHTTLAATYGALVFDDTVAATVADHGICFLSFNGSNSVTLGTFTVVLNATGIMTITV